MRRRLLMATVVLCGALVSSLGTANAYTPSLAIPYDGEYLVFTCLDARPNYGADPCPEDKTLWFESLLLGNPIKR